MAIWACRCARASRCCTLIGEKLPVTIQLAVMAMGFAYVIGVPLGILAAVMKNTAVDHVANFIALVGPFGSQFLARHHADPAGFGGPGLAAGLGL